MTKQELLKTAKPILFNTEMVRSILDGRKTQTRRIIKTLSNNSFLEQVKNSDCIWSELEDDRKFMTTHNAKYKKDDILYVQEDYWAIYPYDFNPPKDDNEDVEIHYKSDKTHNGLYYLSLMNEDFEYEELRSAETMLRSEARIFLKVTDVRVERLQDINIEDILSEGFDKGKLTKNYGDKELIDKTMEWWIELWNSTAKDGYKWEDNPYVFVYEFERI